MQNYQWKISDEDRKKLFDEASLYTATKEDFFQAADIHPQTYRNESDSDSINIGTAAKLYEIISSEFRYSLENAEKFVENEKEAYGSLRVDLDNEFQKFLFGRNLWEPLDRETVEEEIGVSKASYSNYRKGDRSVPREIFDSLLTLYEEKTGKSRSITGDVINRTTGETVAENAGIEEIYRANAAIKDDKLETDETKISEIFGALAATAPETGEIQASKKEEPNSTEEVLEPGKIDEQPEPAVTPSGNTETAYRETEIEDNDYRRTGGQDMSKLLEKDRENVLGEDVTQDQVIDGLGISVSLFADDSLDRREALGKRVQQHIRKNGGAMDYDELFELEYADHEIEGALAWMLQESEEVVFGTDKVGMREDKDRKYFFRDYQD